MERNTQLTQKLWTMAFVKSTTLRRRRTPPLPSAFVSAATRSSTRSTSDQSTKSETESTIWTKNQRRNVNGSTGMDHLTYLELGALRNGTTNFTFQTFARPSKSLCLNLR